MKAVLIAILKAVWTVVATFGALALIVAPFCVPHGDTELTAWVVGAQALAIIAVVAVHHYKRPKAE